MIFIKKVDFLHDPSIERWGVFLKEGPKTYILYISNKYHYARKFVKRTLVDAYEAYYSRKMDVDSNDFIYYYRFVK